MNNEELFDLYVEAEEVYGFLLVGAVNPNHLNTYLSVNEKITTETQRRFEEKIKMIDEMGFNPKMRERTIEFSRGIYESSLRDLTNERERAKNLFLQHTPTINGEETLN